MTNYFFLAPSLHPLQVGEWPDLTFDELISRLEINLTVDDFEKIRSIRRYIDFLNIRALFLKHPIDPRGNLTEKELDDAMLAQRDLPEYVFAFLKRYESDLERIQNLSFLLSSFYNEEVGRQEGFLLRYFTFEREWRLVLTALRAIQMKRDVAEELKFEDPTDPFVADILSQRDSQHYIPPKEYVDLVEKHYACGPDPWQQYETFAKWRFDRIGSLAQGPLFSIDWVLAYLAQYLLVEDGVRLSLERGEKILRKIAEGGA